MGLQLNTLVGKRMKSTCDSYITKSCAARTFALQNKTPLLLGVAMRGRFGVGRNLDHRQHDVLATKNPGGDATADLAPHPAGNHRGGVLASLLRYEHGWIVKRHLKRNDTDHRRNARPCVR